MTHRRADWSRGIGAVAFTESISRAADSLRSWNASPSELAHLCDAISGQLLFFQSNSDLLDLSCKLAVNRTVVFDIGLDQDSPVSLDYYDMAPFRFNGTIGKTKIEYLKE